MCCFLLVNSFRCASAELSTFFSTCRHFRGVWLALQLRVRLSTPDLRSEEFDLPCNSWLAIQTVLNPFSGDELRFMTPYS